MPFRITRFDVVKNLESAIVEPELELALNHVL